MDPSDNWRSKRIADALKLLAWTVTIGMVLLTVVPASERPDTGVQHDLEHFMAFALLGLVFALAYPRRTAIVALSGVAFCLLIELLQIPLPTRHARMEDFVVDSLAVCIGLAVGHISTFKRKPASV